MMRYIYIAFCNIELCGMNHVENECQHRTGAVAASPDSINDQKECRSSEAGLAGNKEAKCFPHVKMRRTLATWPTKSSKWMSERARTWRIVLSLYIYICRFGG